MSAKFPLGQVCFTRGLLEELANSDAVFPALARHALGDWGEVCEEDKGLNDLALIEGTGLVCERVY